MGVRPLPGPRRRDRTRSASALRRRRGFTRGCSATSDPAALPPCDFGIVATKAMHAESAIDATAHAFAAGAVASVMNGVGNEETLARHVARVIRGTTFPAGKLLEPGHVQWDVKGDTTFSPFEPAPASAEEVERTRGRLHARRDAGRRRRRRAPGAVAQGHLQRLHEPDRRPHGPHAWPRVRASRSPRPRQRPRRRGQGGGCRPGHHARCGSGGPDRPRGEDRRWPTATRPRCCRTSRRTDRPKSTISTAASPASGASSESRRRSTTR